MNNKESAGATVGEIAAILAHESGWDEILLVVAPLLGIGGLLWFANNWARKKASQTTHD